MTALIIVTLLVAAAWSSYVAADELLVVDLAPIVTLKGTNTVAAASAYLRLVLCGVIFAIASGAMGKEPLRFIESIPLPGVEGRIDHMALDGAGQRLFVAALGNNTVEAVDTSAHKVVQSISGLHEPQGVAFLKGSNLLAIANGEDGSVRLFDAKSYQQTDILDFQTDADNLRYDADKRRLYVGFGNGAIGVIDAASRKRLEDIKLSAHPESFQLETKGPHIYVNVPNAGQVVVIDREKSTVVAKWPLQGASANFPMALDEASHRLYVGCRQPARLLVLDTQTGATIQSVPIVGDTDDVFYDATAKRIYIAGGEGAVTIVSEENAKAYKVIGKVTTASAARTSFFDHDSRVLYVAVPHRGQQQAELRVFQAQ